MKYTTSHKIAASVTAMALLSNSVAAHAADFNDLTTNVGTSIKTTPNLLSMVCYTGGLLIGTAGVFKLRQHSDAPQQTPVRDGISRLLLGGSLFAAPYIGSAIKSTIDGGHGDKVSQTGFDPVP